MGVGRALLIFEYLDGKTYTPEQCVDNKAPSLKEMEQVISALAEFHGKYWNIRQLDGVVFNRMDGRIKSLVPDIVNANWKVFEEFLTSENGCGFEEVPHLLQKWHTFFNVRGFHGWMHKRISDNWC